MSLFDEIRQAWGQTRRNYLRDNIGLQMRLIIHYEVFRHLKADPKAAREMWFASKGLCRRFEILGMPIVETSCIKGWEITIVSRRGDGAVKAA